MGKAFVDNLLKEMLGDITYKVSRGEMDAREHVVTADVFNLSKAFKDGYNKLQAEDPDNFPESKGWRIFNSSAKAGIRLIKKRCRSPQSNLTEVAATLKDPSKVSFTVPKGNHRIFKEIKQEFTNRLSKKLKRMGHKLTDADDIIAANPGMSYPKAAGISDVGKLNRAVEIHHKGITTVGVHQLARSLNYLNGDNDFNKFLASEEAKSLTDIFGDTKAFIQWDTELGSFKMGEERFPRHSAEIVSTFNLPSFNDNFKDEKIIDDALNEELKQAVDKLTSVLNK